MFGGSYVLALMVSFVAKHQIFTASASFFLPNLWANSKYSTVEAVTLQEVVGADDECYDCICWVITEIGFTC